MGKAGGGEDRATGRGEDGDESFFLLPPAPPLLFPPDSNSSCVSHSF